MKKDNLKTKKPWATIRVTVSIYSDEESNVWDININDGYRSISYDGDYFPTLKEILEEFDF